MVLINGKTVSAEIRNLLMQETAELKKKTGRMPGLATVLVGEDSASAVYVRNKNKICGEVGFSIFWAKPTHQNFRGKIIRSY